MFLVKILDDSGALRTLRSFHLTMGEREMDTMLMMMLRNAIFEVITQLYLLEILFLL